MPKKQTKPKDVYVMPEIYVVPPKARSKPSDRPIFIIAHDSPDHIEGEIAIYKFDRLAKVKRTVTVE